MQLRQTNLILRQKRSESQKLQQSNRKQRVYTTSANDFMVINLTISITYPFVLLSRVADPLMKLELKSIRLNILKHKDKHNLFLLSSLWREGLWFCTLLIMLYNPSSIINAQSALLRLVYSHHSLVSPVGTIVIFSHFLPICEWVRACVHFCAVKT